MSDTRTCCGEPMERGKGKLDQSGETYLPTIVWMCRVCGCRAWEPALEATHMSYDRKE